MANSTDPLIWDEHLHEQAVIISQPEQLASVVDGLMQEYLRTEPDQRSEVRTRLTLPTLLEPLDQHWSPLGDRVRAITRDLSVHGIGCTANDPIAGRFVAIHLALPNQSTIAMMAELLRCEPIGFYFDIGCRLLFQSELILLRR